MSANDPSEDQREIDPRRFRDVLGNFATGVTVITAYDGEQMVGLAANSFTSISLEPPLIGFAAAYSSTTYPHIKAAGYFCVNVLAEGQEQIARVFAQRDVDRFEHVAWRKSPNGSAIIDGGLAWLDCIIESEVAAGDHLFVLGRVLDLEVSTSEIPLLFFRGSFGI